MSDIAPPTYRELNAEERHALEQALAFANQLVGVERPLTMADVQTLYDTAVAERTENETAIIAIGLAFGAQIVARSDLKWVRLSDQWGDETCVGPIGKSINCAPISMIQKRLARREEVNLEEMAAGVVERISQQLTEGKVGDW